MNYPQEFCPICHSDFVYSSETIYQKVSANKFSELSSTRKIRFSGERDKSKFKQLILGKTAPPEKPTITSLELFIATFGGCVGMLFGITCNELLKTIFNINLQALIFIFTLVGYFKALHLSYIHRILKKRLLWEAKVKQWQDSLICLSCGNSW